GVLGVVFARGAAQAAAQVTVTEVKKVDEGARVMLTVGGTVTLAENGATAETETLTVTVTAAGRTATTTEVAAGVTDGEAADSSGLDPTALVISIPRAANAAAVPAHTVSGTIYWAVASDSDAEDEAMTLSVTVVGGSGNVTPGDAPSDMTVVIEDDETQEFVWSSTAPELKEGGTEMVTLTARPTPVQRMYAASLAVDSLGYTVEPTSFSFDASEDTAGEDGPMASITVRAPANDRNRVEDTIKLEVTETGQVTRLADDLSIKVEDVHGLPETSDITAMAYLEMTGGDPVMSVEEGGVVFLEVVADRGTDGYPMGEAIEVALSLSDSSLAEFEEDKDMATVPTGDGETKAPRVKLETKAMDSFPQAGTLVVSLEASGATASNGSETVPGTPLTLTITDATVAQVFVKDGAMAALYGARDAAMGSDGMLNPGDDFSVDNNMLFDSDDGFTFQVDARSSMPAVVSVDDSSGDSISVMPESAGGPAKITLTATALPETSSFIPTQVSASVATIEFEVDVVNAAVVAPGMPQNLDADAGDQMVTLTWMAPTTGDAPTGYEFRSAVDDRWSAWAVTSSMTAHTVTGLTNGIEHTFEVRAVAGQLKGAEASVTATPMAPPTRAKRGQITAMKMTTTSSPAAEIPRGNEVDQIMVGGTNRYHVTEGDNGIWLGVTVRWSHKEIAEIRALPPTHRPQWVRVQIRDDRGLRHLLIPGVSWVSWIDDEGDADFPRTNTRGRLSGVLEAWMSFTAPSVGENDYPGSDRHFKDDTSYVRVLLPVDQHEAENDAFYIQAIDGDVDLGATAAENLTTPVVIIEDIDPQKVSVSRKRGEPPVIYEGAPGPPADPVISSTVNGQALYTVSANPRRIDLSLEVRMDLLEPEGAVRAGRVSLSRSAVTLNANMDGMSNSEDVYLSLPYPDGDRIDNEYTLQASAVQYSLTSGGDENTETPSSIDITVYDRHKLPWLTVAPVTASVAEGGKVKLKVTVDRNPANTVAYNAEMSQYTNEELTVTWSTGEGSTAADDDYMLPTVTIPARDRRSRTYTHMVEVDLEAMTDEDVGDETLVLNAEVNGTEDSNNGPKPTVEEGARPLDYMNSMATTTLTIEDMTMKKVAPRPAADVQDAVDTARDAAAGAEGLNPGESFMVMTDKLFTVATGYTAEYAVSSSSSSVSASASAESVTIMANSAGEADITVTATATGMSSATTSQTSSNVAQVMFKVVVTEMNLTVMLSTPEGHDMNIAEGGTVRVMATTNRPVGADTVVELVYMGGTASAADYEADSIAIRMGEMEGSTLLMAVED
ncbi:MAG: fibronectin type III domain-containing protein, partial [Rhodococcus sp.]|nr:fibronectin type III domain-containing protein [Rhodococcus sp. (in: high G+C Gram-positive bacteria)]